MAHNRFEDHLWKYGAVYFFGYDCVHGIECEYCPSAAERATRGLLTLAGVR